MTNWLNRALALALLLLSSLVEARPMRICVVGDSISAGFYPATHGWPSELAKLNTAGLDFGIKNVAHSGDKVADAAALFASDVKGHGCTWVLFAIGTNNLPDGTSGLVIWQGTDGLGGEKAMVDAAIAEGARVMLLAILPRGTGAAWSSSLQAELEAYNALQAAYANGTSIFFADTYTPLQEPASSPPALALAAGGATDGLHPSDAGQVLIAATVQAEAVAAGGWDLPPLP